MSRKVIICEGATEVGFVRGFEQHAKDAHSYVFARSGTALLDAHGGKQIVGLAKDFQALKYEASVVADGDSPDNFSEAEALELKGLGVETVMWTDRLSIEQRLAMDLPWSCVISMVGLADELDRPVHDQVESKLGEKLDPDWKKWQDSVGLRKAIGDAAKAKKGSWFKNVTDGQKLFDAISDAFTDATFLNREIPKKLEGLLKWAAA